MLQFSAYEELSKIFVLVNPTLAQGSFVSFTCGGIATGVATIVSFPLDVTRTRFIAQADMEVINLESWIICTLPSLPFLLCSIGLKIRNTHSFYS